MAEKLTCTKCGRLRPETEFYKVHGERYSMCKDCLTQYVDNTKPETFLWILEEFDVPYIEKLWIRQTNEIYRKKGKITPKAVLGTYMRSMNMTQYNKYHFSDSDKLNAADRKAKQEAEAAQMQQQEKEEELSRKLAAGEITQQEYNTLSLTTQDAAVKAFNGGFIIPQVEDDSALLEDLTEEDIAYLKLKWGRVYRPDQWVAMETMYNRYANEYEIGVDREEVLRKMCKTSLKMDEAIDAGDTKSYKELASVFDQLRKGGKFTEAQNKEKEEKYLDTIGELVRLCEEHGGPIANNLPDPDEYPQDKIDYTIKDLKAYNFNLVAGEPHMQDLIESFIEKYEKAEEAEAKLEDDFILSEEDLLKHELTDEEASDFNRFLEDEIEADTQALLAEVKAGEIDEP